MNVEPSRTVGRFEAALRWFFQPWGNTVRMVGEFVRARGGVADFIRDPWLHIALVLLIPTFKYWSIGAWWTLPIQILPNVIGFSLGGYAILLAFGDTGFTRSMGSDSDDPVGMPTIYASVSAVFLHFILMQIVALLIAIIGNAFDVEPPPSLASVSEIMAPVFACVGFLAFLYALCLAAAAAFSVFGLSRWLEAFLATTRRND